MPWQKRIDEDSEQKKNGKQPINIIIVTAIIQPARTNARFCDQQIKFSCLFFFPSHLFTAVS